MTTPSNVTTPTNVTIYHNPGCSKSRRTLELLTEQGIEPTIVLYLETPPTADQLQLLLVQLGMSPRQLLRTGEPAYISMGLGSLVLTETALIEAMVAAPILIQRPIVVVGNRATLGRPPEQVLELLA